MLTTLRSRMREEKNMRVRRRGTNQTLTRRRWCGADLSQRERSDAQATFGPFCVEVC